MNSETLDAKIYDLTQNTQGLLFQVLAKAQPELAQQLEPLPGIFQIRGGYAESPGWFMVQAAEFDPEPLTVEGLRVRDIYASERIVQALLEILAGERWLARQGEKYHLTESGRQILAQMQARSAAYLNDAALDWPLEKLTQLTAQLGRIIDQSLTLKQSFDPWSLSHSRNRAPADDASFLQRLSQYCSDFNAFRDDAHMAAWGGLAVDGYVWECFSFVANGQASDAASAYSNLYFRGYSEGEYQTALDSLTGRGWLALEGGSYLASPLGKKTLNKVEAQTDDYFFAPWKTLFSAAEIKETIDLLQEFFDWLNEKSEQ